MISGFSGARGDKSIMSRDRITENLNRSLNRINTMLGNNPIKIDISLVDTQYVAMEAENSKAGKYLENLGINVHGTPMHIGICTDKTIEVNKFKPVTTAIMFEKGNVPHPEGLFSYEIFGSTPDGRRKLNGNIDLKRKFFHPYAYEVLCALQSNASLVAAGKGAWRINSNGRLEKTNEEDEDYDPNATGLRWLINHFHELKFEKNNSHSHNDYVEFLMNCSDDEIFISKFPVIPVFYRDANFSGHKRDIPILNDMYKKVIQYVNALRAPTLGDFSNHTEFVIQDQLVEIRRYGQSLVQGKRGFMKQFVIGKTTAYGARSVITEPITSGAQTPKDLMVDIFHSGFPIATCCSMAYPFIEHWIIDFMSKEFETRERKQILVKNEKGEYELKFEKVGDVMAKYTPAYIERKVEQFMETFGARFEPLTIPMADGSESYMLFTGRPYSKDPRNPQAPPTARRAMTWTDLLYLACVETLEFGGKMAYITRYPLEDYFGTFPSMVRVTSTEEHEPMEINGKKYPFYPKIIPNLPQDQVSTMFVDTVTMDNVYLKGLGGDYDGDTVSEKVCFTEEANDEAFAILNDAKHFISISGAITRIIGNEAFLTYYGMTRR